MNAICAALQQQRKGLEQRMGVTNNCQIPKMTSKNRRSSSPSQSIVKVWDWTIFSGQLLVRGGIKTTLQNLQKSVEMGDIGEGS